MRDELLLYYERELNSLRQLGVQFAEKYPKIAARLQLEPAKCEDPHVERLLEAFAFLAARVHLKVDDEFPEITEALLGVVYPHFIRPVPSMAIVEFQVDLEQGKLTTGLKLERDTVLYSKPVAGVPCKFRTCYETTLWPVSVSAAEWRTPDRLQPPIKASDAAFALRLQLQCGPDTQFSKLGMDRLRFYLNGESALVHMLYELLCSRVQRIVVRDPARGTKTRPVTLPASALHPVGFDDDQGLLPYPRRSFGGYRLLQEFFALPEKFFFLELTGLEAVWAAGFKDAAEIVFLISNVETEDRRQRLELGIHPSLFRLGCVPAVNLFPQTAEPVPLDQRKYEYPVIPDARRPLAVEVYSVDEVAGIDTETREIVQYRPFYSSRGRSPQDRSQPCFWIASRRNSVRQNDDGTDMYLTLVDLSNRPVHPDADSLTVRATCTNRNLPSRLPFGNESGDFEIEANAPIKRIVALRKPTDPLRPPLGKMALWRLISHLSLNYLSLVEEGRDALQQILRLYEFTSSAFAGQMIDGIAELRSRPHFARVLSENGIAFARGTRVEMELDEEQFVGGGAYLFASVIERFLALYASLNSFTQLSVTTRQRKEALAEWPPRAGHRILL
ncbi:MAG: type VI secretion system baseplate subunit TssF [Chthoniobacterales bacterium]|nr:MAG: type VI secretion system baseplate subunit TssF [Chthoniobacterales bacterium]